MQGKIILLIVKVVVGYETDKQQQRNQRRPKGIITPNTINFLHMRNAWVTAWWSAALPGFGYILVGSYIRGFLLVIWEFLININAHINMAIFLSATGRFEQAKEVIDIRWFLLYIGVFVMTIWSAYRLTVDSNKLAILADREDSMILPVKMGSMDICFLDKRTPWVAAGLSLISPGLGHHYIHQIPTSFFLLVEYIVIAYFSNLLPAIHYTAIGAFEQARGVLDPQWLLFLPSLYGFAAYDSYVNCVEYNRLFEMEQALFIRRNYQGKKIYEAIEGEFAGCS